MLSLKNAILCLTICLLCGVSSARETQRADERRPSAGITQLRAKASLRQKIQEAAKAKAGRVKDASALSQKLDSKLIEAWKTATQMDSRTALAQLRNQKVPLAENGDDVVVVALLEDDADPEAIERSVSAMGAVVIRSGTGSIKARVPVDRLDKIALCDGIRNVRPLLPPQTYNTTATEGVDCTLAHAWHSAGFTGQGVKVAVVDVEFANLAALKAQDEIPASAVEVNYSSTSMTSGSGVHGSACAEILYDMVPGAQMYLIKIDEATDLVSAKDYCVSNGISLVTCSLGWYGINFHDGMAYSNWYTTAANHPVRTVEEAAAAGILWVNAGGNEQCRHTLVDWHDADSDDWLDWDATTNSVNQFLVNGSFSMVPSNTVIDVLMTWNNWPTTTQDFDLYLVKWDGNDWTIVSSSEGPQDGSLQSYPAEEIYYTTTADAEYGVVVWKYSASVSPTFILHYEFERSGGNSIEPYFFGYGNSTSPAPGSIVIPADSAAALTVGAVDFMKYATGPVETFSSLGPNNRAYTGGTAVMKPDICGPDYVTGVSYGTENFSGTSAAAPHVAGLAALLKNRYPAYTSSQIRACLVSCARDLGAVGVDNVSGAGSALLPTLTGTPLSWLDRYGLAADGDYEAAAGADTDGDGLAAWQEYVAGTVPTNGASTFYAVLERANGALSVHWMPDLTGAVPARVYSVYGTSGLQGGFPSTPFTNVPAGASVPLPMPSTNRFFKVGVGF